MSCDYLDQCHCSHLFSDHEVSIKQRCKCFIEFECISTASVGTVTNSQILGNLFYNDHQMAMICTGFTDLYCTFVYMYMMCFTSPTPAPLVMHPQSMNGLRRSFLCRVKRTDVSDMTPDSTTGQSLPSAAASLPNPAESSLAANYTQSESVLKLIQSSQNSLPNQYAVLHCTGFIR